MGDAKPVSVSRLIAIPAVITLAVTILWTVILGAIFGAIVVAIACRGKPSAQSAG